jgi:two-component system sensor histidine kinase PilS (NtrC family)
LIFLEDKNVRNRVIFLNSIRIAILSALTLISVFLLIFSENRSSVIPIIISLAVAIVFAFLYFPLLKFINFRFNIYTQLVIDILVITLLVYFSGGIVSPFYFLYILPIITSSIFLKKRDTLYIATISFILFGILSDLMYLKIIPFYSKFYAPEISLNSFIYNLLMGFIAFSTVALISSYYFDRMRKTGEELRHVQENLKDLAQINNTVMEKMENGFITCDSDGKIISYNEKAKRLLNLNSRANVFKILLSPGDLDEVKKITLSQNKYYFETEIREFILGISISLIERIYSFDEIFVFIITDLTEKKKIEEALHRKEHLALIGEMAAGIAHEIRNPLTSISGSVQFLQKKFKIKPEYKNLMDIIITESDRLSNSIEEFLNFTKDTPLEESRFDLTGIVDEIVELVRVNRKDVKFVKKYSRGNEVEADEKKIKQLIWNLINNAVKAVNGNGVVEVNIFRERDEVALAIKDNGVGMQRSELEKIFTPFYSKFTSGIGLGMAIVRRIIEEHGFKIDIQSEKNIGTEVTVNFGKSIEGPGI